MKKPIFCLFGLILILSMFLNGCIQKEETAEESIKEIEESSSEIESLEKELDSSEIDQFEQELDDIDDW